MRPGQGKLSTYGQRAKNHPGERRGAVLREPSKTLNRSTIQRSKVGLSVVRAGAATEVIAEGLGRTWGQEALSGKLEV
jgi:hypothetical protein